MTKTKGILTIKPLSCYYHSKIWLALPEVKAILHLTFESHVKKLRCEKVTFTTNHTKDEK